MAHMCATCTQTLGSFDTRRMANPRVSAAATLYLATAPGVPLSDALCARLADLAAELDVTPASGVDEPHTDAEGRPKGPFWWVPDVARGLVQDVVRDVYAERRKADERRADTVAARTRLTSAGWI
jgi:hypothetical protein